MTTITQYTPEESMELLSQKLGVTIKQSDLAKLLNVSRQYIVQMKNRPLPVKYTDIIEDKLTTKGTDDYITLDYYPDTFGSCGTGVFEFSTRKELLAVPKNAFFTNILTSKQYFVINAYGDSMQPLICDKDKLIVENYDGEQIIDNRVYVFCYRDEIFIKKFVKNVNQLVIMPENRVYDTIKLSGEEINEISIIGRVVGLMRNID